MTRWAVIIAAAFLGCLFMSWLTLPAHAQQPKCMPERAMVAWLQDIFGEFVQATATGNGQNLIITANPVDRKWTALQVTNGVACIVMAGTQFRLHQGT